MRLRRWAPAVAIAVAVAAPVPAQASEVHVETIVSDSSTGEYVVFSAAAGERNRVTARYPAAGTVRVQDDAGLQAGEGCTADGSAGERDRIRTDVENLDGTPAADVLTGNERANEIDGGGGADRIFGLGGNDLVTGPLTSSFVDPGAGADRVDGGMIVRARDGRRDEISSCGVAVADRRDVVRGCRSVRRG